MPSPDPAALVRPLSLSAALLAVSSVLAQAPEDEPETVQPASENGAVEAAGLEEVVVLGTWLAPDSYADGSHLAVDRDVVERRRPFDAEQLLAQLPGFAVSRPGGPGGVSEVFLRGAESNFTAVIVDGLRLNNPANTRGGAFDFSTLAGAEIERLDVATGAVSAIHGPDAMAGVIRIETAFPDAGQGRVFAEAGTDHAWRAGVAGAVDAGGGSLALRLSGQDGGDAVAGASLELGTLSARYDREFDGGHHWRLVLRAADRERSSYPEVSGGPELALLPALETGEGQEAGLALEGQVVHSSGWTSEWLASWSRIEDQTDTPPVPPGVLDGQPAFTSDSRYDRAQLRWVNRIALGSASDLALGLDLIDEDGRDRGGVDFGGVIVPNGWSQQRTTASAFAELGRRWDGGWRLSLAGRGDVTEGDTRGAAKLGVARDNVAGGQAWLRLANGYKLPSFFALGNPLFGNPDLDPERVRSMEAGWDRDFGAWRLRLAGFASRYDDLVDFDFETFTNVNRGRIDVTGVELRGEWRPDPAWRLAADLTLSDIDADGEPLRRRPETTGGLSLAWTPDSPWRLAATARYVGERLVTSIPTGDVEDGDYWRLDATLRYRHAAGWDAWLALDNALDADWQDAPGFPAPGRAARLGLAVLF